MPRLTRTTGTRMTRTFSLALLPLLAACAAAPGPANELPGHATGQVIVSGDAIHVSTPSVQRVVAEEVAAPADRVWAVLPAVFEEMGFAASANAETRTVVTQPRTVNRRFLDAPASEYFDCGRGQFGVELAAVNTVRATVRTTVVPSEGSGSRLETVVEAHARSSDGASSVMAQCRSTRRLEAVMAERVRARLPG